MHHLGKHFVTCSLKIRSSLGAQLFETYSGHSKNKLHLHIGPPIPLVKYGSHYFAYVHQAHFRCVKMLTINISFCWCFVVLECPEVFSLVGGFASQKRRRSSRIRVRNNQSLADVTIRLYWLYIFADKYRRDFCKKQAKSFSIPLNVRNSKRIFFTSHSHTARSLPKI